MYNKEKPETIQQMFGSIAENYDCTNAVLSFQLHRYWNKKLIKAALDSTYPSTYLDLCCGTGEIAFNYLRKSKPCKAFLLDFCAEMLTCAQKKAKGLNLVDHQIEYIQADAQEIPLPSESMDTVTLAYGIRNIKNPQKCLEEIFRVLKPGGTVGILELTKPTNPMMRFGHRLYLNTFLPMLGWFLTTNKEAYRYLCTSIDQFIPPETLEQSLQNTHFAKIKRMPLLGGIATIIIAKKTTESHSPE